MFLILLGGSLTFGAALLAAVIYADGALVALRTAAEIIGWLLLLATVGGLVGMRRKPGPPVRRQQPRRKSAAAVRPVVLAANACATVTGVESVQCDRCSDKLGLAWVACHESVRLQYCETELGDERTCPSPIPAPYPG